MHSTPMCKVINGKRYDTEKSEMIAGDDWWDGHNHERGGTQCFLYRTKKGNFFFQHMSQWQNSAGIWLEPCSKDEAISFWQDCDRHGEASDWETSFPGMEVEDA